ncbi:hypothetical protein WDU94_001560 [Cyamophila willieti]
MRGREEKGSYLEKENKLTSSNSQIRSSSAKQRQLHHSLTMGAALKILKSICIALLLVCSYCLCCLLIPGIAMKWPNKNCTMNFTTYNRAGSITRLTNLNSVPTYEFYKYEEYYLQTLLKNNMKETHASYMFNGTDVNKTSTNVEKQTNETAEHEITDNTMVQLANAACHCKPALNDTNSKMDQSMPASNIGAELNDEMNITKNSAQNMNISNSNTFNN